ncbi:SDR family NAD(P)-dependent oxidoreductase [Paracoccus sp. p4-l81]|uniref:SDR family NAD(P)-dependent oxidoreductase n=1 Tax=unclassified Paracoccus (in: a-proteobacteria) TaxID=2688777 RepID=UPI0035B7A721
MTADRGWVLITGAGSGLGLELARVAAQAGHRLMLSDRPGSGIAATGAVLSAEAGVVVATHEVDLADPGGTDDLWQAAAGCRPLAAVIANAGLGRSGMIGDDQGGGWPREAEVIGVNITALTRLVGLAAGVMRAQGAGRIMTVASIAAWGPAPGLASYHASKAYVLSLSHALRDELRGSGVSVTALCPGPMRTRFFDRAGVGAVRLLALHPVVGADAVARAGWAAMMAGRAVLIPGWRNRLTVWATHLGPKTIVARVTGWLWRKRDR